MLAMRETHGYAKQGVGYGYNKVKGLNALLGMVSTAASAPIIVGHRLRQGTVSSARGAGKSCPPRSPPPAGSAPEE